MKELNTLVSDLKNIYEKNLTSVFLYGNCVNACTKGEITSMVILDKLEAEDIKKAYPAIQKWKKTKNPLPVFMSRDEWFNSTDIYPMEYTEISQRYKVLYGEDLTVNLEIKKCNLRLQCEYELKNLLIFLRESYLGNSENKKYIEDVIKKSAEGFMRIFRAALSLVQDEVPLDDLQVIQNLSEKSGFQTDVLNKILDFRNQRKKLPKDSIEDTIQDLIDTFDIVLQFVDNLEQVCKEH